MLIKHSSELILAVRKKDQINVDKIRSAIQNYNLKQAVNELNSDNKRIVFWVNIYNAFFQMQAIKNAEKLNANWSGFFKIKQLDFLGVTLSFDDLEHVILRRSKWKNSLGYLNKWFPKKWERLLRVDKLDYRIHFILNCGAESCPIIFPLTLENLDNELNQATIGYLERELKVEDHSKKIIINQLFLFYIADFGGKKGLKYLFEKMGLLKKEQLNYHFQFKPFDKSLKLHNFK